MKKVVLVILIGMFLVGCGSTNDNDENSNTNSNSTNNSNSNSVSNSNSNNTSSDKNVVNFYLFYRDTCGYCHDEMDWLKSIEKDYPYLVVHYYEVSRYSDLYARVKADYNIIATGVPVTIISNDYYLGFDDSRARKFLRIIEEESERENCDVVAKIIAKEDTKACRAKNEI